MPDEPPTRRVEVSFTDAAPARRVARAAGVSEVEVEGPVLRCLVRGSFQPFLEALRGSEVIGLTSALAEAAPGLPPASR
jgi:ABC-2 type transport system ATP-binding protein